MPVVPPVYWSTARSSGPVPASNGSAGAVSTSLKETAPGSPANGWRWPSVFSLASVKSTRRIGGISSLMFVTITCSTDAGAGAPGRERTAVCGLHPETAQPVGEPPCGVRDTSVRALAREEDRRGRARVVLRRVVEHRLQRNARVDQRCRDVGVVMTSPRLASDRCGLFRLDPYPH